MPLPPKQQRFVDEYLLDLNATRAAVRAGYSARNAGKIGPALLGKSRVSAAVAAAIAERAGRVQVTADDVVRGLLAEARLPGERSSHAARVSAWGLLGKHLGMFKDKVEHSGGTVHTHVYMPENGRSDAELDAEIDAEMKRLYAV